MNEIAETFKALKEHSQKKRGYNREASAEYLRSHDIPFTSKNKGAHLILEGPEDFVDFWPGTGRWISRGGKRGFGVKRLVRFIEDGI